jgi:hypothetical protein
LGARRLFCFGRFVFPEEKAAMKRVCLSFLLFTQFAASAVAATGPSTEPSAAVAIPPGTTIVKAGVSVKAGTSGKPTAGDLIELTVKVPASPELRAAVPSLADKLKEGPVEWGEGRILSWKASGAEDQPAVVVLTTYKPGKYEIPSIPFVKDGQVLFATAPETIEFFPVEGEKEKDDIFEPQSVKFPTSVWIALGAVSLGLVLGGLWLFSRWHGARKKKAIEQVSAPRVLEPFAELEETCQQIEKQGWVAAGRFKPHYFGLSEAAKRFLGRELRFDAEEKTTRELIGELERCGMQPALLAGWKELFDEMDVTKFTDRDPEKESARNLGARLLEAARKSVTPKVAVTREQP